MGCDHAPAANPRLQNTCVKCGRTRPPDVGPVKPFEPDIATFHGGEKDPTRDLHYEHQFLADALEMATRLTGITNNVYPFRVHHRLDIGRARYGDGNYLTKDNLQEVLEETPDLAAYAVLELQRLRRTESPEIVAGVRMDLLAVSAYGAVADWYAQRALRRLKGEE